MELQISDACRRPLENLRSRQYDLMGPEGEILLPRTWERTIQPGWTISIVFIENLTQASINEHCAQHRDIAQRLADWEAGQEGRNSRWEAERQREREQWEEERSAERLRWEVERQREREQWEEWYQRELDRRLTNMCSIRRAGGGPSLGDVCGISPCLCWLSGKQRRCHMR